MLPTLSRKTAVGILAAAFVLKAILLFGVLPIVSSLFTRQYNIGFEDLYDLIGLNLSRGLGYRVEPETTITMLREPGYPFFLAGVFQIAGYSLEAARAANLVLTAGIAYMLMTLAKKVSGDTLTALLATLVFLFHPGTLISEARGGIEVVFIFMLLLFMLALYRALETGRPGRYLLAGALLGGVVLFRGTPMLLPSFLLAYLLLVAPTRSERIRAVVNIGLLVVGMVGVMSPWVARNYLLAGAIIPTATVQGIAAQEGQFTCPRLGIDQEFWRLQDEAAAVRNEVAAELGQPFKGPYYQIFYTPADEIAFNRRLLDDASSNYRENPGLLVRCTAKNLFFNFWFLGKNPQTTALNVLVQLPLLALAVGGIYLLWKRGERRKMEPILVFIAYIAAVHAMIIAHTRHSVPLVPFLSILASICVISLWRAWRGRAAATRGPGSRRDAES